ncbi:hypothetical protein HYH03_005069 [Edaphochlamys debaryana]|uniref:Adenylyl cyclase-associated protein n=1 Tax=Edaphochlamys debaryana TaxID=47281 RepID=A0A835Y6S9_9CHLO|nr:hypothetical protein HYH03_005069 [Edaphochlamys debaryana]|eukprot:KAG2497073.1 hypothetical protein HYH03_005069 [Edaphochlamys debaryana]
MEAALIARLEKAVERLEKLEVGPAARVVASGSAPAATAAAPAPSGGGANAASALAEWDHLVSEHLGPVNALAPKLPAEAQQSLQAFTRALQACRRVIEVSAVAKKPEGPSELQALLAPVAEAMGAVAAAAEARRVTCVNHLRVLAEAVAGLGFLAYTGPGAGMPPPRQLVADAWQSAEFYSNKLMMEFRGKDDSQVEWAKALKAFMQQLEQFVVRNCPTGLRFDPNGKPLAAALAGAPSTSAPAPAASAPAPAPAPARKPGPPPPPPPGPPPKPLSPEELSKAGGGAGAKAGGGDVSKLFAELSKGEGITSGLRKVTDDMKAKNRPDRTGAVPGGSGSGAAAAGAAAGGPAKAAPVGPPKLELQGAKWVVENHVGRSDLVIENDAPKNSIYVYGCRDSVLQVEGKVNAISLDKCVKVGVVFGDVISVVEAVNCNSIQLQVTGSVPTLSVEKTDGAQLYVSKKCAADPNFQVVTAKCSAVNVVVIPDPEGAAGGAEPEDPVEHAVPEQFISTFQGGKLVTVAAAHSGA